MVRLHLVVNDSLVYLRDMVRAKRLEWGFSSSEERWLQSWTVGCASERSLFADVNYFVVLDLTSRDALSGFKKLVDSKRSGELFADGWWGNGVVIVAGGNVRGKWLSKFVEGFGGSVDFKVDVKALKARVSSELGLQANVWGVLEDFVGEDVELLLNVSGDLAGLSAGERRRLSVEDLFARLPLRKGAVAPWGLLKAVFAGDVDRVVGEFDRLADCVHPAVVLALFKSKLVLFERFIFLRSLGYDNSRIVRELGLRSGFVLSDFKRRVDLAVLEDLVGEFFRVESAVKGGRTRLDERLLVRELLIKVAFVVRSNSRLIVGG